MTSPAPVASHSYKPLGGRHDIRLLVLHGGSGSDPIICRLVPVQFVRKPFYEALSYTWGSRETKETIQLNGEDVPVQANLWSALWHLRKRDRGRFMWVDALCIDQSNHQERNHQVGLMREIYSRASDVLVWLGPHGEDSDLAIKYLSEVLWTHSTWVPWSQRERTALKALCNREYWQRMWILQEVALARSITVHCGFHSVLWEAFDKFCFSPELRIDIPEFQSSFASKLGLIRRKQLGQQESTLRELMEAFNGCACSDPRDRIFALLGLASDCRNNQLRADYSRTLFEVYQDVVQLYFPLSHSHQSHLITPYCGLQALKFSRDLLQVFGGPLDTATSPKKLNALYHDERPVSGITLARPTTTPHRPRVLEPAQGNIDNEAFGSTQFSSKETPRLVLPTLRSIPGIVKSYIFELGPHIISSSSTQPIDIDRRSSTSEPSFVTRSPSKCIQSLEAKQFRLSYEADFQSQVQSRLPLKHLYAWNGCQTKKSHGR